MSVGMDNDKIPELEAEIERLRAERDDLLRKRHQAEEDAEVCSRPGCGFHHWDDGAPLTPVKVEILPGEEGYAEVTQLLCQQHLVEVAEALINLGFGSHNHHGTNMLDSHAYAPLGVIDCGGYGKCSHPAEYGPEVVTPETSTYRPS